MTPEQRRFLGTPRSREERAEQEAALPIAAPRKAETQPSSLPSHAAAPRPVLAPEEPQKPPAETRAPIAPDDASAVAREHQPPLLKLDTASRHSEMLRAVLILGALLLFLFTFYIGKNFERWKYWLFSARNAPKLEETTPDKFPGVSSDELVAQALELERAGRTQEAIDRFMAAKRKNLLHRGILYRVGKLFYGAQDFDSADTLFERAIAFGENLDSANFHRGLIAVRRKDLAAARRYFEAAAEAEPFTGDFRYQLGEVLRLDHSPGAAIGQYRQAAALARSPLEATVCAFKIRMARLEAAEAPRVAEELAEKQAAGPLPVDWMMTAAALNIRQGDIGEGLRFLANARAGMDPGVFASCVTDIFFRRASEIHPAIAEATRLEFHPASSFP
ncbi:hypothetical protein BH20VER1_BH20VER1_17810 [soil metagenome]